MTTINDIPQMLREAAETARTAPNGVHPDIQTRTHAAALLWAAQRVEEAIQQEDQRIADLEYRLRAFKWMLDRESMRSTKIINLIRLTEGTGGTTVTIEEIRTALRPEYTPPPTGWTDFGTHAGNDVEAMLEFSVEHDFDGLPMWERVID